MKSFIRRSLIILSLLAAPLAIHAGDSRCHTILTGKDAAAAFDQCSRGTPAHDSVLWTPSAADIDTLEGRYSRLRDVPARKRSCFQCVGFTTGGKRYIYVNAYPIVMREDRWGDKNIDWEHTAIVVCDGGSAFFGMVYVLESVSVALATNGASAVAKNLGLPKEAFTYLNSHGALDQHHMAFFANLVNGFENPADRAAVTRMAKDMFGLFGGVFAAIELEREYAAA